MTTASEPTFSVLIPAFNVAQYLPRAIASIQAQTLKDFEIIVIDDGSDDETPSVLEQYAPEVRCVRFESNRGISAARNAGIAAARGEYIALLDADDYWTPDKLERQYQLVARFADIDVVFSDFYHVMPDGSQGPWQGGLLEKLRNWGLSLGALGEDAYGLPDSTALALIKHLNFIHPSTVVIRASAFARAGLFDESLGGAEDLQMMIRLADGGRVAFVDGMLAGIEQRTGSLKHDDLLMAQNTLKVYQWAGAHFSSLPHEVKRAIDDRRASLHEIMGWTLLNRKDLRESRRHFFYALYCRPTPKTLASVVKTFLPPEILRHLRRAKTRVLGGR